MSTEEEREAYLQSFEDLSEAKDRGILKKVVKDGSSDIKPCTGDTVFVHYVGTYYGGEHHGEQFDSSRDRNERFKFTIGKGEVIKAWDVGVATMKIGEVCELIASPEYAYKDGKTLKFEVELFETQGLDVSTNKDGSVRKSVLEKGRDILTPAVGLEADISYFPVSNPSSVTDVTYIVGDPQPKGVPECVDLAVRQMNTAERCLVRAQKDSAESSGDVNRELDSYEVRLKTFEKAKHLSTISTFPEQMAYAEQLKGKANDYVKASKYLLAIELYKRLDDDLQYIIANGVEEQKTLTEIMNAVRLNMALVYLKLGDAKSCTEKCKKVLDVCASNEKALFRLGQACLLRKDHEDAAVYFRRIVNRNPKNTAAVNQLHICDEVIRKAKEKEKEMFRGIYERYKETGLGDTGEQPTANPTEGEETCAS
ncbi:unnamed protein product [Calicophoron daubneyi]|uniref:peptidylprolyl isomerase n=1 Tax=Calicophoron daubneyi TaxID=300641 RepID=A0AAV2TGR0_CALDB